MVIHHDEWGAGARRDLRVAFSAKWSRIPDLVPFSERPTEATDRKVAATGRATSLWAATGDPASPPSSNATAAP